eukprot:7382349-Prymnesium_polylepis.1
MPCGPSETKSAEREKLALRISRWHSASVGGVSASSVAGSGAPSAQPPPRWPMSARYEHPCRGQGACRRVGTSALRRFASHRSPHRGTAPLTGGVHERARAACTTRPNVDCLAPLPLSRGTRVAASRLSRACARRRRGVRTVTELQPGCDDVTMTPTIVADSNDSTTRPGSRLAAG